MARHVVIAGIIAAGIAAAWLGSVRGEPSQPPDAARDPARRELAALRADLEDLRARSLHATPVPAGTILARPPPLAIAERAAAAAPADDRPPDAVQRAPTPVELAAEIDGKFAAQDADPDWSLEAAHRVGDALSSSLPSGTTVGRIECRASLCRVESFHASREAFRSFVDATLLSRDRKIWNAAFTSIVLDASGPGVKAVSFIAREGHALPATEPVDP